MRRIVVTLVLLLVASAAVLSDSASRGVNVVLENTDRPTLEHLAGIWNANLIRVVLNCGADWTYFIPDPDLPDVIPERDWLRLDQLLDDCEELGLRVVICLHQWEGYEYLEDAEDDSIWREERFQQSLVDFWRAAAKRYSSRGDVIYGYDILNEPCARFSYGTYSAALWSRIAERVTAAIREYDTYHPVIMETPMYGNPLGFEGFSPIDDDNVIYSFHFYQFEEFVGQGSPGLPVGVTYPSDVLDKTRLRDELRFALAFQERYSVPIFSGELGVSAYADPSSRAAFIDDALSLFEEYGFDYCYWSYCETPMHCLEHDPWSSEGTPDVCYVGDTSPLLVFLGYLARNNREPLPASAPRTCLFDQTGWSEGSRETKVAADLLWRATRVLSVTNHSGPLVAQDVSEFDVVVIGGERPRLTGDEIQILVDHVQRGGGLLLHGGLLSCRGMEDLLFAFGIQATESLVLSPVPVEGSVGRFWATLSSEHQICDGVLAYLVSWAIGARTESTDDTVAWSAASSWVDENHDRRQDDDEPRGPVSIIVATAFGSGRVVVVPDQSFWHPANHPLLINAFEWLARI